MAKPRKMRFINRPMDFDDKNIADDVPDRVRAKMITEVLYNLDGEFRPQGWDAPPVLGFLYQRGVARQGHLELAYLEFDPVPGFAVAYERVPRPHWAIVNSADMMRPLIERNPEMIPKTLLAIVMKSEAWALWSSDEMSEEQLRKRQEAAEHRQLHQHPDRVEVRQLNAVDVDGVRYGLLSERDGITRHIVGTVKSGLSGDVTNALAYFLNVTLGRETPNWEAWSKIYDYTDRADQFCKGKGRDDDPQL